MNEKELNLLLEKFYNGESSEAEESELREFFKNDDIPLGYETEKDIFGYFVSSGQIPQPTIDFETKILDIVHNSGSKHRVHNFRRYLFPLLGAAAGLLLLMGSYFFLVYRTEPVNTFTDPKIAYAETLKILESVSIQLNRGKRTLDPVSKINQMKMKSFRAINQSGMMIKKNLKTLSYLEEAPKVKL
jgi:hypothetical protein